MQTPVIVNCAEIADPSWRFLQDKLPDLNAEWKFFSGHRKYLWERVIRRPNIARFRACLSTAWAARQSPNTVIITHLPRATLWTAIFCKLLACKARHLAFSFNFTSLPTGLDKYLMRRFFGSVDRFVVYSTIERRVYADYFGVDLDRFDFLPWQMNLPACSEARFLEGEYACAVGGEGRDYGTLVKAARQLPRIRLAIVTRSYNVPSGPIPPNVTLLVDTSPEDFWSIVRDSRFVILPLKDDQTNCGHITLVGALMFGRPVVATRSSGIEDYVRSPGNALLVEPGDADSLKDSIEKLWNDEKLHELLTVRIGIENAGRKIDSVTLVNYLRSYLSNA